MFRVRAITNSLVWKRGDIFDVEEVKDTCHEKCYLILQINPRGKSTKCHICGNSFDGRWYAAKCFEIIDDFSESSIEELVEELTNSPVLVN